jgi:prepilin-type N-terminal cleavage/methylation domain-containing protein
MRGSNDNVRSHPVSSIDPKSTADKRGWHECREMTNAECPGNDKMTKLNVRINCLSGSPFRRFAIWPVQRSSASALQPFNALTIEHRRGFTLLELLVVVGIIGLLLVLIAPAFTTIKSGTDVTSAIYGVKGVIENARVYAKANHTYVFVGFAEVDSSVDPAVSPQVTTGPAPYGRVVLAVVASKDGMRHFHYATSNQGSDWQSNYADPTKPEYRGAHLVAVGKLERYENLHFLVDFPSWTPTEHPNSNMARYQPSSATYTLGNAASATVTPFTWPLGSPLNSDYQYRFDKGIYFDPIGVARIATSTNADEIARLMEIDFQPTHGTVVPRVPTNQDVGNHSLIQIAPTSGAIRIYRP